MAPSFQRYVSRSLNSPLIVLLEQEGSDQAGVRFLIREGADDLCPVLALAVEVLKRIGAVDLRSLRGREAQITAP